MTRMNSTMLRARAYVRDIGSNATIADFLNEHDPIGKNLFFDLQHPVQLVAIDQHGKLHLTKDGITALLKGEPQS